MFRAHRAHHQERQIVSIQTLIAAGGRVVWRLGVNSQPVYDPATDTEWQLPEVVLTQFVSLDAEHDVLETCRKLKIKVNTWKGICESRCSFTKKVVLSVSKCFSSYPFFSTFIRPRNFTELETFYTRAFTFALFLQTYPSLKGFNDI